MGQVVGAVQGSPCLRPGRAVRPRGGAAIPSVGAGYGIERRIRTLFRLLSGMNASSCGRERRSGMKIGCVSWCFHSFAEGTNPEEAIDTIGEIGFDGTDLIVL